MNLPQLLKRVLDEARATGAPPDEVAARVLREAWASLDDEARRELLACGLGARVKAARLDADPNQEDGHERG
jgi:hypothetical protein